MIMFRRTARALFFTARSACLALAAGISACAGPPSYSYAGESGPEHWATLSSSYRECAAGTRQSPVELAGARASALPVLNAEYGETALVRASGGHGIEFHVAEGSELFVGGAPSELKQFHFHSPAEHLVAGARYPLEIHFVHEDRSGGLTVLAVFVKEGRTNPALKLIADALRKGRARTGPPPRLKLKTLIASVDGYFAYSGSLTTPPCTQPVSWIVLAEPLEADAATLRRFSEVLGGNARPVQPLDGRAVLRSRR